MSTWQKSSWKRRTHIRWNSRGGYNRSAHVSIRAETFISAKVRQNFPQGERINRGLAAKSRCGGKESGLVRLTLGAFFATLPFLVFFATFLKFAAAVASKGVESLEMLQVEFSEGKYVLVFAQHYMQTKRSGANIRQLYRNNLNKSNFSFACVKMPIPVHFGVGAVSISFSMFCFFLYYS